MASRVKKWRKLLAYYIFRSDIDHIKRRIDSILNTRMFNDIQISNACVKAATKLHGDLKEYGLSDIRIDKLVADHISHYENFRKNTNTQKEMLENLYKNSAIICSSRHNLPIIEFIDQIKRTLEMYHRYIDSIVQSNEKLLNNLFH